MWNVRIESPELVILREQISNYEEAAKILDSSVGRLADSQMNVEVTRLCEQVKILRSALKDAKRFIRNGYDLGYIVPPDPDDLAHRLYPKIRKALEQTEPRDGE